MCIIFRIHYFPTFGCFLSLAIIFLNSYFYYFLCIIFRIHYFPTFGCFLSLAIIFLNSYFYYFLCIIFRIHYFPTFGCFLSLTIIFLNSYFYYFLCIIFRIHYFPTFGCFLSLAIIFLLCVFVNILHVYYLFFTNSSEYNLSSGFAFFVFILILTKMVYCLQSNNKNSFNDSWLLFAALFFFLKVWFKGTLMQI